jgi:hypothetical protein
MVERLVIATSLSRMPPNAQRSVSASDVEFIVQRMEMIANGAPSVCRAFVGQTEFQNGVPLL